MVEEYVGEILEARRDGASGSSDPARRDLAKHDLIMVERDLLQSLAESRDGLERVSRVVKDLKAFAHPDTGHWEVVELHEVIEGALRIVAGALGESVRVTREYEEGALMLRCRPMQIGQVLMNVLVNASQAIAPSGTITVRTGRTGHEAWVEIEDNGAGISADHLSRLFDPFFTTKAMGVGTGLGLSIAHGIVKSHGGRVEVRSDLGAGSTFRIVLPLEKAEAAPAPLTGSRGCRPPPDEGSPSGDDTP
jgi:signal transduction histidine kinase